MKTTKYLYLDQYGNRFWAATRKELAAQIRGAVSIMYHGHSDAIGYVIGQHWLTRYQISIKPPKQEKVIK